MSAGKIIAQNSPTLVALDSGGTVVPVGGTNDLLTHGNPVKFTPQVGFIKIRHHSSSRTRHVGIPTDRTWAIELTGYMQGSGALGTVAVNGFASIDALLQAAGMTRTASAGTSITYAPTAIGSEQKAVIYNENGGWLHKGNNAQGNIVLEGVPTDGMTLTWTGNADYVEPNAASISGFTGGTDRTEAFLSIAGTITPSGGSAYVPIVSSMKFDRGIQIAKVTDANSSTGIREYFIGDAEPTLTAVIAMDNDTGSNLTYAKFHTDFLAKTVHNVTFTQGQAAANKCKFTVPQAQISALSRQEGDKYLLMTVEYIDTHTSADSEFSLVVS